MVRNERQERITKVRIFSKEGVIIDSSVGGEIGQRVDTKAVTATPLNASESTPAVFTVIGASLGATCTATETVPLGYTASQLNCANVPLGGSCTITNTLIVPIAQAIPTLSEWALLLLAGLLAMTALALLRQQVRH